MISKILSIIILISVLTVFKTPDRKTIHLNYGFEVTVGKAEDFGNFETYSFFELSRNNKIIYSDSTFHEYEFYDELYPLVFKTGENSYELLFEINDRPNKSYLKRLSVLNDMLSKEDRFPTFISEAKDLDLDGIKEFAGFWDYSQSWDSLTVYNPIIYYEIKNDGLKIDSSLTIERNKLIYGGFHGFLYSSKEEQSIKSLELFREEIERIENLK